MDRALGSGSDEEIWASFVAGDGSAFDMIFSRHVDAVYVQCARRAGSYDDAQDLTSIVFTTAWKSSRRVRFVDGSMLPWLLVVATNVAARHLRSMWRYTAMLNRLPRGDAVADPADVAVESVDLQRRARDLAHLLDGLNSKDHAVIALVDLGERSYAEAAAILKVPIGTIRSRRSRAHEKLRMLLSSSEDARAKLSMNDPLQGGAST